MILFLASFNRILRIHRLVAPQVGIRVQPAIGSMIRDRGGDTEERRSVPTLRHAWLALDPSPLEVQIKITLNDYRYTKLKQNQDLQTY